MAFDRHRYEHCVINLNPATNTMNPRAEALLTCSLGTRPSLGYGRVWPNPLADGADVMTMSTYKSLGGPPSGLLAASEPGLAERLDAARRLAQAGLLTSAIGRPSGDDAGLRLGVNQMIRPGASLDQVDEGAELVEWALPAFTRELEQMASGVADLRARFRGSFVLPARMAEHPDSTYRYH